MSSCPLLLLPRVALLALLELEGQSERLFFRVLGLVGRRALAAPLAHRRRRLARVAVRARVPVRRQGRARRRLSFARGGRRERERPFRAVHGRVLCVVGVARHFVVRALAGDGSEARRRALRDLGRCGARSSSSVFGTRRAPLCRVFRHGSTRYSEHVYDAKTTGAARCKAYTAARTGR